MWTPRVGSDITSNRRLTLNRVFVRTPRAGNDIISDCWVILVTFVAILIMIMGVIANVVPKVNLLVGCHVQAGRRIIDVTWKVFKD